MRKQIYILLYLCLTVSCSLAQTIEAYPVHWWTGMKNTRLQLMIHDKDDLSTRLSVNYQGIQLLKVHQPENRHYVFVDLNILPSAKPGKFTIRFQDGKTFSYELKKRNGGNGASRVQGVHANDFIYLIMADRFVNGDPSNDQYGDLRDKTADRNNAFARHGGDLKGVENRLDYLQELGVTAIWMTPIVENDMPRMQEGPNLMSGYHGYWITDHYKVDKRMGGNEAYRSLVEAAHRKGMKIIQDAVYNHVGSYHHTVLDLPMRDWLNQWPSYQGANHREEVFTDPYASVIDKKIMVGGWFVPHLPDLNLANPFVANFIIQNTIWATEEFGIDGWRVDTYKYCDEKFLNAINTALEKEFPKLTVFGEAWNGTVTSSAYFAQNNIKAPFSHNTQGVTDFPLNYAILDAINQNFGWNDGVSRLYNILSQDILYKNPLRNCIFLDNHDMNRFYSVIGEKPENFKLGIGLLMTMRGIPQLYYGTEIMMKNFKNPTDAEVRKDFPGGWINDPLNKFTKEGRTEAENEAFDFIRKIAAFRKKSSAIGSGKLMHYIPQDGMYVYFRYDKNQTVMCILNSNNRETNLDLTRFSERIGTFKNGIDVLTGKSFSLAAPVTVPARQMFILELNQ